jgi:hypothetical protein
LDLRAGLGLPGDLIKSDIHGVLSWGDNLSTVQREVFAEMVPDFIKLPMDKGMIKHVVELHNAHGVTLPKLAFDSDKTESGCIWTGECTLRLLWDRPGYSSDNWAVIVETGDDIGFAKMKATL